jgi:hypothetical protein
MYWLFVLDIRGTSLPYIVKAQTQNNAIQRLHLYLYAKDRETWTDRWEDLYDDIIEQGSHDLYGPFDEIPTLT